MLTLPIIVLIATVVSALAIFAAVLFSERK
jgi:hypothetical protein